MCVLHLWRWRKRGIIVHGGWLRTGERNYKKSSQGLSKEVESLEGTKIVIGMRGGDHSPQVFKVHRVRIYRICSWRRRIISLGGNGNKRKLLKVMGMEGRGGSWPRILPRNSTLDGRRRGR